MKTTKRICVVLQPCDNLARVQNKMSQMRICVAFIYKPRKWMRTSPTPGKVLYVSPNWNREEQNTP